VANIDSINWDLYGKHVQPSGKPGNPREDRFISSRSTLILIPRKVASDGSYTIPMKIKDATDFFPVGVISDMSLTQDKQVQQIFEIGSNRSYFVPGYTMKSVSMNRVLFSGANLLKLLAQDPAYNDKLSSLKQAGATGSDFYINLSSLIFDKPITLALLLAQTSGVDTTKPIQSSLAGSTNVKSDTVLYAAAGLEYGFIRSHNVGIAAGNTIVAESVQLQFDLVVPISVSAEESGNSASNLMKIANPSYSGTPNNPAFNHI